MDSILSSFLQQTHYTTQRELYTHNEKSGPKNPFFGVCKKHQNLPSNWKVKLLVRVFFKDSNIIFKYSILGDCCGLKKKCL